MKAGKVKMAPSWANPSSGSSAAPPPGEGWIGRAVIWTYEGRTDLVRQADGAADTYSCALWFRLIHLLQGQCVTAAAKYGLETKFWY